MKPVREWPAERADRHATALLHDEPAFRLVAFTLAAHQEVPVHTSASNVIVTVVSGTGAFSGAAGSSELQPGESAVYAPQEPHGMIAGPDGLRFLAVITPSPSAQRNG